jgi:hypothetical protein
VILSLELRHANTDKPPTHPYKALFKPVTLSLELRHANTHKPPTHPYKALFKPVTLSLELRHANTHKPPTHPYKALFKPHLPPPICTLHHIGVLQAAIVHPSNTLNDLTQSLHRRLIPDTFPPFSALSSPQPLQTHPSQQPCSRANSNLKTKAEN